MRRGSGLGADSRGVSEVLGFVFIFGIIVILLTINQAQVVPAENQQVEFNHNDRVQGQLQELRNSMLETAGTGTTQPVAISLGTQYPNRLIAVNPPPVNGRIETQAVGDPPDVTVENARALDSEAADYWNGTTHNFTTRSIVYQADYRVLSGTPNASIYENTLLYNRFDNGATIATTGQFLIQDGTITLVIVNGSIQESGTGTATLDPQAISGPYQKVAIENDTAGEPINITIPSTISPQEFRNLTELPAAVQSVTAAPGENRIRLSLTPDTYNLRMAKVGFGVDGVSEPAHYITLVERPQSTIQVDTTHEVTVEVRDKYNNGITGFQVNASATDGTFVSDSVKTGSDGQAEFTYDAPSSNGTVTLEFSIYDGSPDREVVSFELDVTESGQGSAAPYQLDWLDPTQPGVTCDPPNDPDGVCTVDAGQTTDVTLTAETDPAVEGADVDFSVNNSTVGTISSSSEATDGSGQASTTFTPDENGDIAIFAASGGTGDRLDLKVVNASGGGGGGTQANFDVNIDSTNSPVTEGETLTSTITVTNNGGQSDTQTISLTVENQNNPVDTQSVTLDPGQSDQITLEWQTEDGDGGAGSSAETYTITVESEDSSDSDDITVNGSGGGGGPGGN